LANTAIGQEDVRLSPLMAANLAAAIARGGVARDARLVLDVERNGRIALSLRTPPGERAMSPATAAWLAFAMRRAVAAPNGTARTLADLPVPVAVKTGTAERPDGRVNGWIAGYLPWTPPGAKVAANRVWNGSAGVPRIAFAVFAGDLPSPAAHQAVRQMVRDLVRAYVQFHPSGVIS
ncbi:MAG: hypothetical protein IRZ33_10770, partial [Alicyclobacillaceae bacterium]|nr:hypothetical protein [Alicyclobacillaceae bacterium]